MQPNSPKIEAKMERLSTATMSLPLVQWQAGRKMSQTVQIISMQNVRNLASLKLSGRFQARKATVKLPRAKDHRYPRTQ